MSGCSGGEEVFSTGYTFIWDAHIPMWGIILAAWLVRICIPAENDLSEALNLVELQGGCGGVQRWLHPPLGSTHADTEHVSSF